MPLFFHPPPRAWAFATNDCVLDRYTYVARSPARSLALPLAIDETWGEPRVADNPTSDRATAAATQKRPHPSKGHLLCVQVLWPGSNDLQFHHWLGMGGEGPSTAECLVWRLLPLVFSSNSQPPSDYYRGAHENRAALTTNTTKTEDFRAVITSTRDFFSNNNTMIIFYQLLSLFSEHRAIRKTWKYKYSKL